MATASKRGRGSAADGDEQSTSLTQDDLEQFRQLLMEDVNTSIQKSIQEFGQSFGPKTITATADLVKKLDHQTEKRFRVVEQDFK